MAGDRKLRNYMFIFSFLANYWLSMKYQHMKVFPQIAAYVLETHPFAVVSLNAKKKESQTNREVFLYPRDKCCVSKTLNNLPTSSQRFKSGSVAVGHLFLKRHFSILGFLLNLA